jgi:aromatic-L-amino-acid decarboxylase
VLRCYGREGLRARIREHVRLARAFASWVEAEPGWELAAPVPFSTVCFRREGGDEENEAIVARVNESGEAFLAPTRLRGRLVIRLAVGNVRTTEDDVRRTWDALRAASA